MQLDSTFVNMKDTDIADQRADIGNNDAAVCYKGILPTTSQCFLNL